MKAVFLLFAVVIAVGCKSKADPIGAGEVPASCGKWDKEDCSCPNGKTLIVDGEDKHCVDIKSQNICLRKKNGFQWALHQEDGSIFNSCLYIHGKTKSQFGFRTSRIYIRIDSDSFADKMKFARWADSHKKEMAALDPWATPSAGNFGESWVISKTVSEERAMSILDPMMLSVTPEPALDYYTAPKVFPNIEEFTLFLENSNIKNNIDEQVFPQDKVLRHLLRLYQSDWSKTLSSQVSLTENGCSGSCWNKYNLEQKDGYSAELWMFYLGDVLVRSEIVLMNQEKEVVGTVYLANKRFLLASVIDRDSNGLYKTIKMYNSLGAIAFTMENNDKSLSEYYEEQKNVFRDYNEFNYLMAVCEDGFNPVLMSNNGMKDSIAFGPFTESSFYGWLPETAQKHDYWNGRVYINSLLLPIDIVGHSEHAAQVSAAALEGTMKNELGIVPISIRTCTESAEIQKIWPTLKEKTNVRVVNFSSVVSVSERECERMMEDHPLTQDPDILWVAAGGNYSMQQSQWCPQYLSGQSNLILAAGSDGDYLASYSNSGEDFMDIAAPGRVDKESLQNAGTSFAAPRVSQVAAKIFYFYPSLTAHEVKIAILLGAEEPWSALPVRSRGILNEKRAMGYAALFHQGVRVEDAVKKMECSFYNCSEAKQKLEIFKKIK